MCKVESQESKVKSLQARVAELEDELERAYDLHANDCDLLLAAEDRAMLKKYRREHVQLTAFIDVQGVCPICGGYDVTHSGEVKHYPGCIYVEILEARA